MRGVPSRPCHSPSPGVSRHLGGAFSAPLPSFYDTVIEMGGEVSYEVNSDTFEWRGACNGFRSVLWGRRLSAVRDRDYWTESRHRQVRFVADQLRGLLFTHIHHVAPFPKLIQIVDVLTQRIAVVAVETTPASDMRRRCNHHEDRLTISIKIHDFIVNGQTITLFDQEDSTQVSALLFTNIDLLPLRPESEDPDPSGIPQEFNHFSFLYIFF